MQDSSAAAWGLSEASPDCPMGSGSGSGRQRSQIEGGQGRERVQPHPGWSSVSANLRAASSSCSPLSRVNMGRGLSDRESTWLAPLQVSILPREASDLMGLEHTSHGAWWLLGRCVVLAAAAAGLLFRSESVPGPAPRGAPDAFLRRKRADGSARGDESSWRARGRAALAVALLRASQAAVAGWRQGPRPWRSRRCTTRALWRTGERIARLHSTRLLVAGQWSQRSDAGSVLEAGGRAARVAPRHVVWAQTTAAGGLLDGCEEFSARGQSPRPACMTGHEQPLRGQSSLCCSLHAPHALPCPAPLRRPLLVPRAIDSRDAGPAPAPLKRCSPAPLEFDSFT